MGSASAKAYVSESYMEQYKKARAKQLQRMAAKEEGEEVKGDVIHELSVEDDEDERNLSCEEVLDEDLHASLNNSMTMEDLGDQEQEKDGDSLPISDLSRAA